MKFIRIEDRNRWVLAEVPQYHPDTTKYLEFWREQKKRCIEGFWNEDFGKYRFMPGNLYFYVNFCTILHVDKKTKVRQNIRPYLRDLEWELSYMLLEARGFSGFLDDPEYTSNHDVLDKELHATLPPECFKEDGTLKTYIHPREAIRGLHDKPMGRPLYHNNARNTFVLGSRGGGKSYTYSLAVVKYDIIFDGAKVYDEKSINEPAEIHVNVGSGNTDKSAEFCKKVEHSIQQMAISNKLGVWGKPGDPDYESIPFYKTMKGTLTPNNAKSPYIHEYEKNINGEWIKGFGTKSKIIHSAYKDNAEAGAGGRYLTTIIEEVGLTDNVEDIHLSNVATVTESSTQFGCQHYLGTSGNMEKIQGSRRMFCNPDLFNIVSYEDEWEQTGQIGFFLPAYYSNNDFKDANGNTDVEKAIAYYEKKRDKFRKAKDSKGLYMEMMNYPIKPSEMFMHSTGNIFPVAELKEILRKVEYTEDYKYIETAGQLIFNPDFPRGIEFKPDMDLKHQPIMDFPTPKDMSHEGCLVVYEHPIEVDGEVPKGMYVIGHDPVGKDGDGPSFASIHVLKTPKYRSKYGGNELVASYFGRPAQGRRVTNELLEKLAMYYGAHSRMIFFENKVGNVKEYFEKRKKLRFLATQPETVLTSKSGGKPSIVSIYGFPMDSPAMKVELEQYIYDWLVEERGKDENDNVVQNMHLIKDRGLLKELIYYNRDGNFDRVISFGGCIIGIAETYNQYIKDSEKVQTGITLDFLASNKSLFKSRN